MLESKDSTRPAASSGGDPLLDDLGERRAVHVERALRVTWLIAHARRR
jgi:hypothetical protein